MAVQLVNSGQVWMGLGSDPQCALRILGPLSQEALADLLANPLMLLASCVNTPIYYSVFQNLPVPVARCSASCVNVP